MTFSLVYILVSGQCLANLAKEMLTKIPTSDQSFDHFYANVSRKSEGLLALVNQRFQESDALWPHPKIKDQFRRVCYEANKLILSSVLSISTLIRKASAPMPRWRPFWLKLLMVTTMKQSSCFLTHHAAKMLIQGRYLGMQLSILEVMLKEKISCFDEILLAMSKSPELEKKLIQEVQTICKLPAVNPATSAAGECSFSSQCTACEDVVSIQDG